MTKVKPLRIDGDIAYVPLTKGYEAKIDIADAELVGGFNWCADVSHKTVYAIRKDYSGGKPKTIIMHRMLMGFPNGMDVDHKDCNGLNNIRSNLRRATKSQNRHNQKIRKSNSSGYKGVSWDNEAKKWRAQIKINRKVKNLGRYENPAEAHAAYCEASKKFHGEFGRTE